jgi:hypothetical protein
MYGKTVIESNAQLKSCERLMFVSIDADITFVTNRHPSVSTGFPEAMGWKPRGLETILSIAGLDVIAMQP